MATSLAVALLAYQLGGAPLARPGRSTPPRLGFEVEDVSEQAVGEMGVFGWPGLEKRTSEFSQSAASDELLMVYIKEGSATLSDEEETKAVSAGQMVMVSDGAVKWSGVTEGGVTLISTTTPLADVDESGTTSAGGVAAIGADDDPVKDLTLKDAALLLGAGLVAGGLAAFGANTFFSPG